MAGELLFYRPMGDLYEEWLERIAELISVAHEGSEEQATSHTGLLLHVRPEAPSSSQAVWLHGATCSARRRLEMT